MRLFLLAPTTIFAARVNMPSGIAYPLDSITFDTVTTGAYTDIKAGQTVLLGTAAGLDDLGRGRVRKTPTSTILYVGRSSQGTHDGEFSVADNAFITVKDDFRVWAKPPYIDPDTGTIYKDSDIVVGTNTSQPPPVANCGPGTCATVAAGIITVQFVGTASFAVANGASISTYLWDIADGTFTVGTSASSSPTATFPAGFRWVSLTVTDSNGKTHVARCPVYARNSASDTTIPNWQMESHRITPQGQQVSVKILSSIPATTYPDGTLAMIADGEPASASDRSHMVFIGWHHLDPATIAAQKTGTLKDTTLQLLDVAGKLDTLPGFPQSVEYNADPDVWTQMSHANMDRYLHYLLYWHSTALGVADWTNTGTGDTYPFVVLSSDGASLWEQVARRAKSLVPNYILTCNTLGQMFTKVDPMLQDTGSRTATVQATLAVSDWQSLRFTHQRPARYHWLRANAILASLTDITPLFAISPGEAPAQGESAAEQGEQLAASQSALNSQEGHRYARLNAPESHFSITLAAGDDLDIEPANMTWVRLTITAALAAQRGLAFTTARGLVHSLSIRYDHARTGLVRSVELEWEREVTSGLAAVTEPAPSEGIPPIEFDPPPTIYDPTPPPSTPTGLGFGTVYVMDKNNLYRTRDFSAVSPTWVNIGPSEVAGGHAFKDFILDPWAPATIGYLCSNEGVYKATDLDQVAPTFSLVLTAAAITTAAGASMTNGFAAKLIGSPNIEQFLAFFYEAGSGTDVWIAKTLNRGTSWSHVRIIDTAATSHDTEPGAVDIVPHLVGGALTMYLATDDGDQLYKSTDSGATWSVAGTFPDNIANPHVVHCPYEGNEAGQIVYVGTVASGGGTPKGRVYKSVDGGANFTTVSAITDRGIGVRRTGIEASPLDNDDLYAMVERFTGDAGHTLWISTNGGSSWTQAAASGYTATQSPAATSGFPYAAGQLYLLTANAVLLSTDGGATFTSKLGTGITTPMDFASADSFNMGVIVPLWVEE
jgi:hypothetical protein